MATKNVAEGRMVKEFRQSRRAAGGKELERWLPDRKGESGGGPYTLILAIPRLVKSTVRQFESLCEPFIYYRSPPPHLFLSLFFTRRFHPSGQTGENITRRGERRNAWRSDKEGAAEILAEAVILMRVVLKFYVTLSSPSPRAPTPLPLHSERGIKL